MLGLLSCLGNALVALLIWKHVELQAHPQKIIMYIAATDACMFCNRFMAKYYCTFRLNVALAWTLNMKLRYATNLAINLAHFYDGMFLMLSINLNLCLCVDLILMLYKPLVSP